MARKDVLMVAANPENRANLANPENRANLANLANLANPENRAEKKALNDN
jgi:hypothetical protein